MNDDDMVELLARKGSVSNLRNDRGNRHDAGWYIGVSLAGIIFGLLIAAGWIVGGY